MRKEVQVYLVKALAMARAWNERLSEKQTERQLASFSGGLAALRCVDEVTADEERDWEDRMHLALGITPHRVVLTTIGNAEQAGGTDWFPEVDPTRIGRFVRSLPVPDVERERHGGQLRVIGVDVYELMVNVRWGIAPRPDLAAAYPDEAAQLSHDLEGLDASVAETLKNRAEGQLRTIRLYNFDLADDLGTAYRCLRGSVSGVGNGMGGDAQFFPAPTPTATILTFTWLDVNIDIPLS